MNQTHIHLFITHLPIFGSILGAFVLAQGLWKKSNPTIIAAFTLFIVSAVGGGMAYLTGEAAEETIENVQGVSESIIEQHEEFALIALVAVIILGAVSLLGMSLSLTKHSQSRTIAFVALLISLISFGLFGRTGYLGGQIRHTEISSGSILNQGAEDERGHEGD